LALSKSVFFQEFILSFEVVNRHPSLRGVDILVKISYFNESEVPFDHFDFGIIAKFGSVHGN
jgi:hypothetical protein